MPQRAHRLLLRRLFHQPEHRPPPGPLRGGQHPVQPAGPGAGVQDGLHGGDRLRRGTHPDEDPDEYRLDSPASNAGGITTPTLIFDGTDDFLPWQTSAAFHNAIDANGTPVRFLLFEGEGHGLLQWNSRFIAAEAQLLWFRQYLAHN